MNPIVTLYINPFCKIYAKCSFHFNLRLIDYYLTFQICESTDIYFQILIQKINLQFLVRKKIQEIFSTKKKFFQQRQQRKIIHEQGRLCLFILIVDE